MKSKKLVAYATALKKKYNKKSFFWKLVFDTNLKGKRETIINMAFVYKIAEESKVKPFRHSSINSLILLTVIMSWL